MPDVETRTGLAAGIGYAFRLGNGGFAFQPELLYVQKGGKFGDDGTLKIDELDLPLAAGHVGITTRSGLITRPLRERFGNKPIRIIVCAPAPR